MIAFIEGKVGLIRKESVAINVGGLGYEVFVIRPFEYEIGQNVFLYTYQQIREDTNTLFGFKSEAEYDIFLSLLGVKGIGPKIAMNALAHTTAEDLTKAIDNQDIKALKKLPGIGDKAARQIVLDLKGKIRIEAESGPLFESANKIPFLEATQGALEALGYKESEIVMIEPELSRFAKENSNVTEQMIIREALKLMAKRKGV